MVHIDVWQVIADLAGPLLSLLDGLPEELVRVHRERRWLACECGRQRALWSGSGSGSGLGRSFGLVERLLFGFVRWGLPAGSIFRT